MSYPQGVTTIRKVIDTRQPFDLVKNGIVLGLTGFIGFGLPEEPLTRLEAKFIKEKAPTNLPCFLPEVSRAL